MSGRCLLVVVGVERERARDRALRIGRRQPVGVEEPSLHAIVEAGYNTQRVFGRRAVDDVATGQNRERPQARAGPQKLPARRPGQETGSFLGEQRRVDGGGRFFE
jgi:hypothetical protein